MMSDWAYTTIVPLNWENVWKDNVGTYFTAGVNGVLGVSVSLDRTEVRCVTSKITPYTRNGEVSGEGFVNVACLMWGGKDFSWSSQEYNVTTDTTDKAWANMREAYGSSFDENIIFGFAVNDKTHEYSEFRGTVTEKLFSTSPGAKLELVTMAIRYAETDEEGNPRPIDKTVATCKSDKSFNITIDENFPILYYPWAFMNGKWLSCNRSEGSLKRYQSSWNDVQNDLNDVDPDKSFHYKGGWVKSPLIGEV